VAEELFASTRDRVNGMGGVAAWRDREKEQKEWRTKWDREEMESAREKAAADNEGQDDREVETYNERDVEGREEEQEEETSGKDDDVSCLRPFLLGWSADVRQSFTMDMMLKTLNIDLKLIGYDKEAQRWDG
jgi:Swi5-dependent recombination DNA repair protein 1